MSRKCEGDLLRASFSRVFSVLPKALRQLFINSYQSIIWNEFAMKRFHNNIHNDIPTNPNDTSIIDDHIPTTTINEINYSNKNVVELKNMLREKSLKLSGKKDELIARLEAYDKLDIFGKTSIGDSLGKNKNIDNIMESTAKISDRPSTFFVSDTAVVGDIVLVDLHKNPLSAWHVAAQNISLNGNHIPLWSSTPVLIRANFDALRDESDSNNYVGGASLDRSNNRHNVVGGRGDGGRGRGRGRGRGGVSVDEDKGEERAEITEIKACYHVISKEDEVACLYPIESVIIPLPGDATYNPKEGEMTKRLLAEKMQVLLIGNHQDKIFRLAGAYRHLVTVAKNVRLAPVRKMKNDLNSIDSADDSKNEIDEDIIYNDWSYNGDKESMDATIEKRKTYDKQIYKKRYDILENSEKIKKIEKGIYRDDLKNKDTGLNMPVEKTRWMKINSNLNQKSVSDTHLSPFSSKVEKLWESNILPNLIADIYEGSTTTSKKGLPGLPSSLSRTIEDRNIDINDSNIDTIQNLDDVDNVLEIEGIRISFSLCASTYATTYLEHLVETMNSQ
jgi:tRNA(Glu) U13 pseudouridine synthase TruD